MHIPSVSFPEALHSNFLPGSQNPSQACRPLLHDSPSNFRQTLQHPQCSYPTPPGQSSLDFTSSSSLVQLGCNSISRHEGHTACAVKWLQIDRHASAQTTHRTSRCADIFFKLRISRRKLLELAVLYAVARPSSASSMALQDPQRGHGAHARAAQFEP